MIKLVAGLGNKPTKYLATRHNIGFWAVDRLALMHKTPLKIKNTSGLEYSSLAGWYLCKPSKWINCSGEGIRELANKNGIEPEQVLVIHDEIDLPLGRVRIKHGGGHAGHNGLKDIERHLHSKDFWRVRIGVGHPRGTMNVDDYVLSVPPTSEKELLNDRVQMVCESIEDLLAGSMDLVVQRIHSET